MNDKTHQAVTILGSVLLRKFAIEYAKKAYAAVGESYADVDIFFDLLQSERITRKKSSEMLSLIENVPDDLWYSLMPFCKGYHFNICNVIYACERILIDSTSVESIESVQWEMLVNSLDDEDGRTLACWLAG